MAIIIIEGADGSGKTTLTNQLKSLDDRSLAIVRRSGPPKTEAELNKFCFWTMACPSDVTLIVDRYPFISEKIYGPVLRGHDRLFRLTRNDIAQYLLARVDLAIIYCRPQLARIHTNALKQHQLEGVQQKLTQIITMYDEWMYFFRQNGVKVRNYDYELQNPETLLNDLLKDIHDSGSNRSSVQTPGNPGTPVRTN